MILHNTTQTKVTQLLLVLMTILLAACGESEMAELKKYVDDMNARKNSNVPALPEFKHIPSYFYEVGNMRDPFIPEDITDTRRRPPPGGDESKTETTSVNCPRPDPYRVRAGLELMPIDSLRMVGTLEEGKVVWGLVTASDETIHHIQPGDYLGQNSGKVVNIEENKIDVMELIPDKQGCVTETLSTLVLFK